MESLAVKYRPKEFADVCSQYSIIKILEKQLETNNIKNCYLFCGPSGCGKTTLARIFANKINNGLGNPIEIDAASNNGVDNVRAIIEDAKLRSLDSKYKVYIIDECHSITNQGWQSFLKCIEEPPAFTIFMFCTTDPQKIPNTIINRVMRFNLTKINTNEIINRLKFICEQEHYYNYNEAVDYIAKLSNGGMRDAIATLEKASDYSKDLSITNVLQCLGNFSYDTMFDLTNSLVDREDKSICNIVDSLYNSGNDLRLFIEQYIDFILDLCKYIICKDIAVTKIPLSLEKNESKRCVGYCVGFDNSKEYFKHLADTLLELKYNSKNDSSIKDSLLITLLSFKG